MTYLQTKRSIGKKVLCIHPETKNPHPFSMVAGWCRKILSSKLPSGPTYNFNKALANCPVSIEQRFLFCKGYLNMDQNFQPLTAESVFGGWIARQPDCENGALILNCLDINRTAMLLHNPIDHGKP
jgi:hypothetical protein